MRLREYDHEVIHRSKTHLWHTQEIGEYTNNEERPNRGNKKKRIYKWHHYSDHYNTGDWKSDTTLPANGPDPTSIKWLLLKGSEHKPIRTNIQHANEDDGKHHLHKIHRIGDESPIRQRMLRAEIRRIQIYRLKIGKTTINEGRTQRNKRSMSW